MVFGFAWPRTRSGSPSCVTSAIASARVSDDSDPRRSADAANANRLGASSARGRATREVQDADGASPDDAAKRVEGVPELDIGRVREVPFRAGAVRFRIRGSDRTPRAPRLPPRVPRRLVYETLSPTTASASSDLAPGGVPACGRVTRFARGSAKAALDDAID